MKPDPEFIQRHEQAAADAVLRREKLWTRERTRFESHSFPESPVQTPGDAPSWDDLP